MRVMAELERVFQAPVIEAYGDDRDSVPGDKQSVAPWQAEARVRGDPGGARSQGHGRRRQPTAHGHGWRGCHPAGDNVMRGYEDNAVANLAGFPKRLV